MMADNNFCIITSALSRTLRVMLKPELMGGEELEARKADHVEQPSEGGKRGRGAYFEEHPHTVYRSRYATSLDVVSHSH